MEVSEGEDDPEWGSNGATKGKKKKRKKDVSPDELLWVQCEICSKWRSFSIGTPVSTPPPPPPRYKHALSFSLEACFKGPIMMNGRLQ